MNLRTFILVFSVASITSAQLEILPGSDQSVGGSVDNVYDEVKGCEPIASSICRNLPYTMTIFPNLVGSTTQAEAGKRMDGYRALLDFGCSDFLRVFLCSVYFPMCNAKSKPLIPLKPCREFCQHVQSRCEPIMRLFSYKWPSDLRCTQFPAQAQLCLVPKNVSDDKINVHDKHFQKKLQALQIQMSRKDSDKKLKLSDKHVNSYLAELNRRLTRINAPNITCNPAEVKVTYEHNDTCLTRCDAHVLFTRTDKQLAEVWTTVWAVCCMLSSLLTVITYAADASRFRYPERPIVYLCICYLFYSLTFIIRAAVGASSISCRELDKSTERFLIRGGHEGTWCTITFLINYFFIMASCLWWVILTLAWFLSAAKKWGHEGVEAVSSLFHMVAWAGPAVGTIVILIMHRIDGEELTGMCSVGSQDRDALLIFIIVPMCILLMVGIVFLLFGFVSLMGVRKDLKMKEDAIAPNIRRLEKLMVRIGIFSVLYVIPYVCVVGSYFYEFFNMPIWIESIRNLPSRCLDRKGLRIETLECKDVVLPAVEVYMLKLFMSLVVGITSGTWVWGNKKSFASWSHCLQLLIFRRRTKLPAAPQPPAPKPQFQGGFHGQQTPLIMHSGATLAKQGISRSVTSKLNDRMVNGGASTSTHGRVSSSCV